MDNELRRPRCECCDEVLEEVFSMRQNFEKFFHRFDNQIVELRRELRASINKLTAFRAGSTTSSASQNTPSTIIGKNKSNMTRSDSPWSRCSDDGAFRSITSKTQLQSQANNTQQQQHNLNIFENQRTARLNSATTFSTQYNTPGICKRKATAKPSESPRNFGGDDGVLDDDGASSSNSVSDIITHAKQMKRSFNISNLEADFKKEPSALPITERSANINSFLEVPPRRSFMDYFGIQLRVIPTCPFNNAIDFEQWDCLLTSDEDRREHLRVELMQGHFDDAEKYLKHIWKSVLGDEAAQCYSYKGNAKNAKKAVNTMTFTSIFKECFLQRYEYQNTFFFMERTTRFFNYAHDRLRRNTKVAQNTLEGVHVVVQPGLNDDAEQSIDDTSMVYVLPENYEDGGDTEVMFPEAT